MKNYSVFISIITIVLMAFSLQLSLQPVSAQTVLTSSEEISPEQIVQKYFLLAREGKLADLKLLVTKTPKVYLEARVKKMMGDEYIAPDPNSKSSGVGNYEPSIDTLVTKGYPELIQEDRFYIKEISKIWIKGNEARIRVLMGREEDDYRTPREFFLYRTENKEWKIFQIAPKADSETYAVPD